MISFPTKMDGKGKATDNIFIERLWRRLTHEYVYINPEADGLALYHGPDKWFKFYNDERHHQRLDYQKPIDVYR